MLYPSRLILDERIEFEAHISIVAFAPRPDRRKRLLSRPDEFIVQFPSDLFITKSLLDQFVNSIVKMPVFDDLRDDGRIRRGTRSSPRMVPCDLRGFHP